MEVVYLISSHFDYERPRLRLLRSMANIPNPRKIVVVGGERESSDELVDGIQHWHVTQNSFDYTAAIEFSERKPPFIDHVFLLHDTMEFTSESDALISAADPTALATAAFGGQCNLMLCRADHLYANSYILQQLRNCTKLQAVKAEGLLWKMLPDPLRSSYANANIIVERDGASQAVYGGAPRISEMYTGVAIRKFKANWGQNWNNMAAIP